MGIEARLLQKMSQSLTMTPQLQQAIKLLQYGRLEYIDAIQQELLENPILEESRDDEYMGGKASASEASMNSPEGADAAESFSPLSENTQSPMQLEDYLANLHDYQGASTPKGLFDHSDKPSLEATLTKEGNLQDYLGKQLQLLEVENHLLRVVAHILGNLDPAGYLCSSYEEIADECSCDVEDVLGALDVVKSLEPAGLGARNLAECLLFQLESQGLDGSLSTRMLRDHLELVEKRKIDIIAKLENTSVDSVKRALEVIQTLNPRPGAAYAEDDTRYVTPDIYVYKDGSEYRVSLNEEGLPRLRISPYYLDMLRSGVGTENKQYIQERVKAASWLMKSIQQRQQTIFKVTESIVKHQRAFLEEGVHCLKPLVLKEIADDIGMHESTVSRVTTNKYVHTPQGVYELKYFFTTGIRSGSGEVSSSAVKERIRQLIAGEDSKRPISDQQLVDILQKENVDIARRTVAKYREGLGILASSQRKAL